MQGRTYDSLTELFTDKEFLKLRIAEINACGALHAYLSAHPNHYYSEWFDGIEPGEVHDSVRCEDLQRLSYPDGYFDIILTSETIEHVPDPDNAWHEIHRALKVGGYHIFTIPVIPSRKESVTRAKILDSKREDYLEPAYHGVWGDESMFVYTDFGMGVVEKLDAIGLKTQIFYQNPEDELDVAVVFRSRKSKKHSSAASAAGGSKMLEWTGERYLPWLEEPLIGYEHLHRYAYATQFAQNKRALDLACGEGYGSRLLARTAESVVGIDIDENAIRHAKNKYIRSNLQFKQGSITDIPIEGQSIFDVIVCFEAIEHIDDHEKLLKEVKRLLTPDGLFIVSTPNKWAYSDEPKYENPFHVRELYLDEFTELLKKYFKQVKILGQRIYCNSNIWPIFSRDNSDLAEYVIERNPREFAFVEGDKRIPLYFIVLASDAEKQIDESASNLVDISNELLKQKDAAIGNLTAARDNLEGAVRNQQQALNELTQAVAERDRLNQEVKQFQGQLDAKEHQVLQLTTERDRLNQEIKQLQVAVQGQLRLQAERDQLNHEIKQFRATVQGQQQALDAKGNELVQLQATAQAQGQELATIKDTIGWKVLNKYRETREKSAVFRYFHFLFTKPVKRASKKKTHEAINLTSPNEISRSDGIQPSIIERLGAEMPDSSSEMIVLPRGPRNGLTLDACLQCTSALAQSVLVVSHWLPAMDRASGELRAFSILQILREKGHNVVFGADREKSEHVWFFGSEQELGQYEVMFEQLNIEVLYGSKDIMRHLNEKGRQYDWVILAYPEVAYRYLPAIRAYAINAKVICDPVDLHWLRMKRESEIKNDDVLRQKSEVYRRMEWFNAAAADIVLAITHEEKAKILKDVTFARVEVIPNIHACADSVKPLRGRQDLLFIGHYAHNPNEDAVRYFVNEIFPLIRQQIPGVVFYMVGSHMTEIVQSLASQRRCRRRLCAGSDALS